MAINNFKPFALDPNANVTSQADWEALPALLSGFTAGKASSAQVNKAIRQASFIAAALAQYTANKSGLDVLDDGDLNGFISKMGTAFGKDFQALDATLSALAGLATGANKLPYFTGNDTAAQTDLTSVGRDIIGKNTIADILTYLQFRETVTGIVGASRNAKMSVTAASTTATFSADELIVESSDGKQYRLKNFSKTINLAASGAGGMDTGSVPAAGFVALYAIYNPATSTSALLAVNATSAVAPEIYGGANMPAGYSASALVSVWRIDNSQFVIGFQYGRSIATTNNSLLSTSALSPSSTALNIASMIPKNARRVTVSTGAVQTSAANATGIIVQSSASGLSEVGTQAAATTGTTASNASAILSIIDSQTIYYKTIGSGTGRFTISTSGYEI